MAMRSRVASLILHCLCAGVAMLSGWLFRVANADFAKLRCTDYSGAGWQHMNDRCGDAGWLMWRAGPVALAGLVASGPGAWRMHHA